MSNVDNTSEEFIREVEEDYRRDKAVELLRRYGFVLVIIAVALVAGVAGFNYWRAQQRDAARQLGAQFVAGQALAREGKFAEAVQMFGTVADKGVGGYPILAKLARASALARSGDKTGAVAQYDAITADSSVAPEFRQLAAVGAIEQLIDDAPPEQIDQRLKALTGDDGLYRYTARELTVVMAIRMGNIDLAKQVMRNLADDAAAPQGVRTRMAELLAAYGG